MEGAAPTPGELVDPNRHAHESPPGGVPPVVVPRWIQLVLLPLAILGAWALARAAGPVLLLFVIAALIALLLNPFVSLLRRAGLPRGLAVFAVYLGLLVTIAALVAIVSDPIAGQVSALSREVPDFVQKANGELAQFQRWLDEQGVDLQIQDPGRSALATLGDSLTQGTGELVTFTRDALTLLVEGSIALILIIVLSIYMLLYGERIGAAVRSVVPAGDGTPEDDFPTRIEAAVFGYVRGQILFSTIMGTSAGLGLWVLGSLGIFPDGRTYALFFGAWYGFAELIPYVGPAVGGAPPVLVALLGSEPLDALWLTLFFTGLQQIEGHVVAPQVFAHSLRINPLLVIAALLIGGRLYGLIGAFVSLPIAAILRESVVYFRRHLVLEPWTTVAPAGLAGAGLELPQRARPAAGAAPPTRAGGSGPATAGAPATAGRRPPPTRAGGAAPAAGATPAPEAPASAALPPHAEAASGAAEPLSGLPAAGDVAPAAPADSRRPPGTDAAAGASPAAGCPECGADQPHEASVCVACGTQLADADEAAAASSSGPA